MIPKQSDFIDSDALSERIYFRPELKCCLPFSVKEIAFVTDDPMEDKMMKRLTTIQTGLLALCATMVLSASVWAAAPAGAGRPGQMMHAMQHGPGYYGAHWKQTLTDDQRTKVDKIRLDYLKKKYPLKAKKKAAKTELALLVAQDSPNRSAINKKIVGLVDLKKQLLQLRYDYKLEVRKLLTAEQRVQFDTALLKKAHHGKRYGRH